MNVVESAIDHIGLKPIAERYGFVISAIHKWKKEGRLPKSDLAGLTCYAQDLEELSGGKYRASELLAATRRAWQQKTFKAAQARRQRQEARTN